MVAIASSVYDHNQGIFSDPFILTIARPLIAYSLLVGIAAANLVSWLLRISMHAHAAHVSATYERRI